MLPSPELGPLPLIVLLLVSHSDDNMISNQFIPETVTEGQRMKNREAIKAVVRCANYVVHHHVAHTTNYEDECTDV